MTDPGHSSWGQPADDPYGQPPPQQAPGYGPPPGYPPPAGYGPPPGYPPPPYPYGGYPQPRTTNALAIASLVGAFFCSIAGLICGIMALNQLKERPWEDGRGLAIAGIVISALSILAFVFFFVIVGSFFSHFSSTS